MKIYNDGKKFPMVYYNKQYWYLNETNEWENSSEYSKENEYASAIGFEIKDWRQSNGLAPMLDDNNKELTSIKTFNIFRNMNRILKNRVKRIDREILMTTLNGWLDDELEFHTNEIPFDPAQIKYNIDIDRIKGNEDVDTYLKWISGGNENAKKSLLAMGFATLIRKNIGLLGIIYSPTPGTGKTQFLSLFKEIAGNSIKRVKPGNIFAGKDDKFSLTNIENKTGIIGEELPTHINKNASDIVKNLIDPSSREMSVENKGQNSYETDNILSMLFTTNRISNWYEHDAALKTRITVINMRSDIKNFPFNEKEFKNKILYNADSLGYLLKLSYDAFKEASNTKGYRAEPFRFGLKDTEEYWGEVAKTDTTVLDFLEINDLFDAIEHKSIDFIANSDMKKFYGKWKAENSYTRVTVINIKKDLKKYIEDKFPGVECDYGKTYNNGTKTIRGFSIEWNKKPVVKTVVKQQEKDVPWELGL